MLLANEVWCCTHTRPHNLRRHAGLYSYEYFLFDRILNKKISTHIAYFYLKNKKLE